MNRRSLFTMTGNRQGGLLLGFVIFFAIPTVFFGMATDVAGEPRHTAGMVSVANPDEKPAAESFDLNRVSVDAAPPLSTKPVGVGGLSDKNTGMRPVDDLSGGFGGVAHMSAVILLLLLITFGYRRFRLQQKRMNLKTSQLEEELRERKRVEEELRESEERFRQFSEASFGGIMVHDNGVLLMANQQWFHMVGYSREELMGKQVLDKVVAPESLEEVRSRVRGNFPELHEVTGMRKDGSRFPMEVRARPFEYRGRKAKVVATFDMTEQRKNLEINRTLFKLSAAINTTADLDELYRTIHASLGRIIDVTNFLIALYNPGDETVSFPYFVSEADESFPGVYPCNSANSLTGEVVATGRPLFLKQEELIARQKSRTKGIMGEIPLVWLGVPLKVGDEVIGIMGVQSYTDAGLYDNRDVDFLLSVSEQVALAIRHKRVNDQLREREQNLRIIFGSMPDAITITRLSDGAYIHVNEGFSRITGYSRNEALGKLPSDLFTSPSHRDLFSPSEKGGREVDSLEVTCRNRNGSIIDILLSTRHIRYADQACVIAVGKDITGVKKTEEEKAKLELQLQHAQKMEAIGTLAGGIAHDFNNLMMAIQGNVSLLNMDLGEGHPGMKKLRNISDAVERGSGLTRQLLGFSRGTKFEGKASDLNEIMQKNAQMFGRTRKGLTIVEDYAKGLWPVQVDGGQIDQVLLNLFVNASHAMEGGGKLMLATENVELAAGFVKSHGVRPGRYVKMSVEDTGIGMDPVTKSRIFEPFFTTREKGRGTGLGLATTYTIIKKHKGFVLVDSEPGNGTRFDIYLPCSDVPVVRESKSQDRLVGGNETILLVDDERLIREISTEILGELGYKVVSVESGRDAVEIFRERKEEFHMVILDMVMPDMGGGEVFDALRGIDGRIKVLLSSGYSLNSHSRVILDRGCAGFLQKPFNINQLAGQIRQILDS